MKAAMGSRARGWFAFRPASRTQSRFDPPGLRHGDAGTDHVLRGFIDWLCRAQDCSTSADGGVAHNFSMAKGWSSSYPETTGYIVPTFIDYARRFGRADLTERARRMADWLVGIRLPSGGFQGGRKAAVDWVCLTGSAQIAYCWLLAFQFAGETRYRDAAFRTNQFVHRTVRLDGPGDTRGAVNGSFWGKATIGSSHPNWAAKFLADSLMLEADFLGDSVRPQSGVA